jgi:uncharacterized protein YhfF
MAQFPVALQAGVSYARPFGNALGGPPRTCEARMISGLRTPAVQAYWQNFCRAHVVSPDQRYDVFAFGDSPALADELLALVLAGPKRATAALVLDFERAGDPLPERDLYSVVLDGRGEPRCIIRTTEATVQPFDRVDARFAWDEGEGDRTLASWLEAHRPYFTRQCASWDVSFDEHMPVVFERFELVWPDGPHRG